jgi:hypothetical protein
MLKDIDILANYGNNGIIATSMNTMMSVSVAMT